MNQDNFGPCAKQVVTAIIVKGNDRYTATNYCRKPQEECPRKGIPSGERYDMCHDICDQVGHAEINVLALAGKEAKGAQMMLTGNTRICDECMQAIREAGVVGVYLLDKKEASPQPKGD